AETGTARVLPLPDVPTHIVQPRVASNAGPERSHRNRVVETHVEAVANSRVVGGAVRIPEGRADGTRIVPLVFGGIGVVGEGCRASADLSTQMLPRPLAIGMGIAPIHECDRIVVPAEGWPPIGRREASVPRALGRLVR